MAPRSKTSAPTSRLRAYHSMSSLVIASATALSSPPPFVFPGELRRERESSLFSHTNYRIQKKYLNKRRTAAFIHQRANQFSEEAIQDLLDTLREGLSSKDLTGPTVQSIVRSLEMIRSGLDNPDNIDAVIQAGMLPLLDDALNINDASVQLNTVWTLCNMACGDSDQTALLLRYLPRVSKLIESDKDTCLQSQCLWLFANIAGDSKAHRDAVLSEVKLATLKSLIGANSTPPLLENLARLIGNIARQGPFESDDTALEVLAALMCYPDQCDCMVVSAVCRALLRLLFNSQDSHSFRSIGQHKVVASLVKHSTSVPANLECTRSCFTEMVKLIAHLLSSEDYICQMFIDQGALDVLSVVIHEELHQFYYYACLAIANVFACGPDQIQHAINHDLLTAAIQQLENGEFREQREAGIALCSFLAAASKQQVLQAFNEGLVPPFVRQLRSLDPYILYDTLASLFNLMKHAEELQKQDECLQEMLDANAQKYITALVTHSNEGIATLAKHFLNLYLNIHWTNSVQDAENAQSRPRRETI